MRHRSTSSTLDPAIDPDMVRPDSPAWRWYAVRLLLVGLISGVLLVVVLVALDYGRTHNGRISLWTSTAAGVSAPITGQRP